MTNKIIGKAGEEIAKNFLINNGFEILEMNYRYSRMAEIDIIAKKKDVIHFVEVKTRTQDKFGTPFEAVTQKKLANITACAKYYLMNNKNLKHKKMQIDVIGVMIEKEANVKISYISNIFC